MIKRGASKATESLVNTAQNEHFNIAQGIRTDVPITGNKSVVKSINFISDPDGAYTLRPPLILKESIIPNTWYLYDKIHILTIDDDGIISITNPNDITEIATITFKYFDKTIKLNELPIINTGDNVFAFLSKIISVNTFKEYTLISSKIDISDFSSYISAYNTRHSTTHSGDLVYADTDYSTLDDGNLYRFIKIYQDTTSEELSWIIEIVYTELNSFTASMSTDDSLETNLLLDNPYAIRDLYGYGYISATKIFSYVPLTYTKEQTEEHTICRLTESIPVTLSNSISGYKMLVSASPKSLGPNPLILKAFLTTAKTDSIYYGVWEESTNGGVDWKVCPEFIAKFQNHPTNPLVTKTVSDLTSEEFEKTAYQESLDQAASYLVEKKLVRLNYKYDGLNPADLSETDLIKDRPDVLYIQSPNLSKKYRFQIYVDTLKETEIDKFVDKIYMQALFTELNGPLEDVQYAEYDATSTYSYDGVKGDGNEDSPSYTLSNAEIDNTTFNIVLYPKDTGDYGNTIRIKVTKRTTNSYIKKVVVGIGKNDCKLKIVYNSTGISPNTGVSKTIDAQKNSNIEFENSDADASYEYIFISNVGNKSYNNSTAAYITSLKVVYALEGTQQTTSTYLVSTTGTYQVSYSEDSKFADSLDNERKLLFTGKTYEYENQILLFNKYNLFISNVGSSVFSLMKTLTFSTEVVNVINWRSYLLIFTEKDISLAKYLYDTDTYSIKTLSTSVGIPKKDAETVCCILNSVYFKSGYKIYKLVPNLYASVDDILNLNTVSDEIDLLIENLLSPELETKNFVYANAYRYYLFIPLINKDITYCFVYDYVKKIWNLFKYPVIILGVENLGISEEYLKTDSGIYYFKDNLSTLLNSEMLYYPLDIVYLETNSPILEEDDEYLGLAFTSDGITLDVCAQSDTYTKLSKLIPVIPYVDFLNTTLKNIYLFLENSNVYINDLDYKIEDESSNSYIQMVPIEYLIDFGQKSSNYTLFKTFLETKLTLATLSEKDTFPFEIYISTDGTESPLHWDVNTDSALWKNSFSHKGTLSTFFAMDNEEYSGIIRQLIVKYSGKGKTIHHTIKGISKYNFKFYSMDVRSRLLPKKQ